MAEPEMGQRQLMEATADQAVIKFTGSGHFETTSWQSTASGAWEKERILRRPGWQKTTRCTSATAEAAAVCEECWDETSCWTFGAGSRRLAVPGPSSATAGNWTRFVSSIHVRCDSPVMRLRYQVQGVRRGELNLRWDGIKLGGQNGQDDAAESSGLALPVTDREDNYLASHPEDKRSGFHDITVLHPGGHVLELEFIAFGTGSAGAELTMLELSMPESYAQCEDFKVCLDPLAANSPGSVALRNSNPLQLACLEAPVPPNEDCSRWLGCLSEDRKEQLVMLLRAAGVGETAVQSWATAAATDGSGNATTTSATQTTSTTFALPAWLDNDVSCVDPRLEDAESWSCDCFSEMETMCAQVVSEHEGSFSYERCVRAQMCNHANVCASWKADMGCDEDPTLAAIRESLQLGAAQTTQPPQRRLEQMAAGLLSRRGTAAVAAAGGNDGDSAVERALTSKTCS